MTCPRRTAENGEGHLFREFTRRSARKSDFLMDGVFGERMEVAGAVIGQTDEARRAVFIGEQHKALDTAALRSGFVCSRRPFRDSTSVPAP